MAGSQDMMIVVMMMMMSSVFAVLAGGTYFMTKPEEGDECKGTSVGGNYVIDENGDCVLDYCDSGYTRSGGGCVVVVPDGDEDGGGDGDEDEGGDGDGSGSGVGDEIIFHASTLPSSTVATFLDPQELVKGTHYYSADRSYYLVFQGDNNLCINQSDPSVARWCLMSNRDGDATAHIQGDGNVCVYSQPGYTAGRCTMSHDSNVPNGQHKLVMHNNGNVYMDHGTGATGISTIYNHP